MKLRHGKTPKKRHATSHRTCSTFENIWFGGLVVLGFLTITRLFYLTETPESRASDLDDVRIREADSHIAVALVVPKQSSELNLAVHVAPTPPPPAIFSFLPANGLKWVVVSSIEHCQEQLRPEELAAITSWQMLRPSPTIVLMCECQTAPSVPEGVLVVFRMSFLFQSLRRLGGISVAADRAKATVPDLGALAWVDISVVFNEDSVIEFSRLFALLAPHPFRKADGKDNRKPNQALLALPLFDPSAAVMDFKIVLDPPRDPVAYEKTGVPIADQVMTLWTVPGSPSWAEWLTAGAGGVQDEYGEEFLDQERQRCDPPLKSCYECSTNEDKEQNCAVCKNFMYLSHGRCRKQCRPGTGQVKRGKGRFFRYCADPDAVVVTTSATTTTEPMLPSLMPEVTALEEEPDHKPDAGTDDDSKSAMKSILVFSTIAAGQSTETTDFTQEALTSYCDRHGCTVHFHQSVDRNWPGIPPKIGEEKFEKYHAFLNLFADKAYSDITTFVFIDSKGTIVQRAGDLTRFLPSEGSAFDVHFGNQKSRKKAGRPNTAFIAAKRSSTALMLFKTLAGGRCPIECSLTSSSSANADTFDQCCLNGIAEDFARIAVISQDTPVQAFSSWDYTKMGFQKHASMPLIVQCADNTCTRYRPVAGRAGKGVCNYKRDPAHCRVAGSTAALKEASLREIWQTCDTYLYDHSTKCAPATLDNERDVEQHSYTIVVSTFNRDAALLSLLPHWLGCNNVSAVLVVWHNPSRKIIQDLQNLASAYKRLTVLQQTTDELSNRYIQGHDFKTEAVFSVDDDEWYSSALMTTAFGVWREAGGESMVAFNPRWLNFSAGSEESYAGNGYQWNGVCKPEGFRKKWEMPCGHYNTLFVTKGGFLNRRFHRAYFEDRWSAPRGMVNEWSTAEDILMTAVHAATSTATSKKILAVSALSRHIEDYYGTLTWSEMKQQEKALNKDPNSLHFLTENHRGDVRMEVIRNMLTEKVNKPKVTTTWYDPASLKFVEAHDICTNDLGVGCHVF